MRLRSAHVVANFPTGINSENAPNFIEESSSGPFALSGIDIDGGMRFIVKVQVHIRMHHQIHHTGKRRYFRPFTKSIFDIESQLASASTRPTRIVVPLFAVNPDLCVVIMRWGHHGLHCLWARR